MRVAVIGSRGLSVDISEYIPKETNEIISGGAKGIDSLAECYADKNNIPKLIIRPEHQTFGMFAMRKRNRLIVECADMVLAIWDGKSRGTKYTIDYALRIGKPIKIITIKHNNP